MFYESDEDRGSDYEDIECGGYDGGVCRSGVMSIAREEEPWVTTVNMGMAGYLSSVQGSNGDDENADGSVAGEGSDFADGEDSLDGEDDYFEEGYGFVEEEDVYENESFCNAQWLA